MMYEQDEPTDQIIKQARLLIRAALWVSMVDDGGGKLSNTMERTALLETLQRFSREDDYHALLPILQMAIEYNKAWDKWGGDLNGFTDELKAAAPTLQLAFCQCLYDVAFSVATRFRERGWFSSLMVSIVRSIKIYFSTGYKEPEMEDYLSISPIEKEVLNQLATILSMPQRVID